jgi:hypothetical protein
MRDRAWLEVQLDHVLVHHYPELEIINEIEIKWGPRARSRFGSIRLTEEGVSRILINGVFRDERVPLELIWATIGHELAHYAHGFCSKHPQKYPHPHRGDVVGREMAGRGMGEILKLQKRWAKEEWPSLAPTRAYRRRRRARAVFFRF